MTHIITELIMYSMHARTLNFIRNGSKKPRTSAACPAPLAPPSAGILFSPSDCDFLMVRESGRVEAGTGAGQFHEFPTPCITNEHGR